VSYGVCAVSISRIWQSIPLVVVVKIVEVEAGAGEKSMRCEIKVHLSGPPYSEQVDRGIYLKPLTITV
jgi:hypothetical protein